MTMGTSVTFWNLDIIDLAPSLIAATVGVEKTSGGNNSEVTPVGAAPVTAVRRALMVGAIPAPPLPALPLPATTILRSDRRGQVQ